MKPNSSPILSKELRIHLGKLGPCQRTGRGLEKRLKDILPLLFELPISSVVRTENEIVAACEPFLWYLDTTFIDRLFRRRNLISSLLNQHDTLKYILLFHRDGRIREAALSKITGGLPSPFIASAIAWRMNDWVPQVRSAAEECATRTFPKTNAQIIAEAASRLLTSTGNWHRWTVERKILAESYQRADVAEHLVNILKTRRSGSLSKLLRQALRGESLDIHLLDLARNANQPHVRLIAIETILNEQAHWPVGRIWLWVNKPDGIRRKVVKFESRPVKAEFPYKAALKLGLSDKSPVVRRAAIQALLDNRHKFENSEQLAKTMLADTSPAVRERAEFILRPSS